MACFLITGGAGFIGSHLAEYCLARGHRVIVLDDLSTGDSANINHLRGDSGFEFIAGSVLDSGLVGDIVPNADVIFHLAATVGVKRVWESPTACLWNNIQGTDTILRAAIPTTPKIVLASTSEVYGDSPVMPVSEHGSLGCGEIRDRRSAYAFSKLTAEALTMAYWREFHIPAVIARLFNTIGPRQAGTYGMVVPRFLQRAYDTRDLIVYGDGLQTRSFCFVDDMVRWLMALALDDRAVGEAFNLGNPEEVSIDGLAKMVISITEAPVGIRHVSYEEAYGAGFSEARRRVPDIRKIVALTNREPQVSLKSGIDAIWRSMSAAVAVAAAGSR
jgi:UDP-glucose 4-epimerase